MARYVDAIDLPLPIQDAFDYLADFSHTAEWDPSVVSAERLDREPIGVGSRFRVTLRFLGTTSCLDYQITEYERPGRLVLTGGDESLRSIDEISFVARGSGTRVTYEARVELAGLRKLADPLLDIVFQRIGQLAARGLRERIHQRQSRQPSWREAS
jgi:carbon monoxide dehydrogenase subunit G